MSTKVIIWKQGQFYPELGKKIIELGNSVYPGPSDNLICIEGFHVHPDKKGDYVEGADGIAYSDDELDAIHTYGTMRMVINLYEKLLNKPIVWSWQQKGDIAPLTVRIRNNDINARYLKDQRCIDLDYYGPDENRVYNCRTVDIIAHETGHAIVDSLKPEWENGKAETKGLVEAFCDLTAMFLVLDQKDLCEFALEETYGDLSKSSLLTFFGVGHGPYDNSNSEIRNALNKNMYKRDHFSSYDYTEVIVGLLYDVLCDLVLDDSGADKIKSEKLQYYGQVWRDQIVTTFIACSSKNPTLIEFGELLIESFKGSTDKVYKHLKARKIFE